MREYYLTILAAVTIAAWCGTIGLAVMFAVTNAMLRVDCAVLKVDDACRMVMFGYGYK